MNLSYEEEILHVEKDVKEIGHICMFVYMVLSVCITELASIITDAESECIMSSTC